MEKNKQIIGLDGVRFLAALMVMFFHLTAWSWLNPKGSLAPILGNGIQFPELSPISWLGWTGVEVFFVLSGYVIALSARNRSPIDFVRGRVNRLFPAAVLCAAVTFVVAMVFGIYGAPDAVRRLLNAMFFFPLGPWIDGSYWTLGIEISFYTLVTVAIGLKAMSRIDVIMGVVGAASTLLWACVLVVPKGFYFLENRFSCLLLLAHGCLFATGLLLWAIRERGATPARLGMIAVSLTGVMLESYISGGHKLADMGLDYSPWLSVLVVLAALSIMVLSIWNNNAIHAAIGPRGASIFRSLGLITYPFYLLHAVAGVAMLRYLHERGVGGGLGLTLTAVTIMAAAAFVALIWEPWFGKVVNTIFLRGVKFVSGYPRDDALGALIAVMNRRPG